MKDEIFDNKYWLKKIKMIKYYTLVYLFTEIRASVYFIYKIGGEI